MGRDALEDTEDDIVENIIQETLEYWDGYYVHPSCIDPLRTRIQEMLDKHYNK